MNILVVHSTSDLYGASKILLQTVAYLSGKGNKVIVILSDEGPLADAFRKKSVTVQILKLGILRRKYFTPQGMINRIFTIRKAVRQLGHLADLHAIDVIYSNTSSVLAGALVARRKKIKHVWHIHEIITSPAWFIKFQGWLVNRFSDKVIVVSEAVKKHWQAYIDRHKISVIHNGIEYDEYLIADGTALRKELNLSNDVILMGMIGRVHPWKGQQYFLHIAKHITDKYRNVKFVMVGDAYPGNEYLYDELEKAKHELGLCDQVFDLGYRKDIPLILSALDIFVLPSVLPDPLPTVILEAMAAGKPVAATAHGGALEMVQEGVTGLLIPWDDERNAAKAILPLIENEQMRKQMGQKGSQRVLTFFSEKAYFSNLEKVIALN